jgi:hypothetical protein
MARASEGEGCEDWSQWGECERANMRLEHVGGREGFVSNANACVVLGAACRDIANGSASLDAEDQKSKVQENSASQTQSSETKRVRTRARCKNLR